MLNKDSREEMILVVQLLDKVKFVSFSWLKTNRLTSAFSYNDW